MKPMLFKNNMVRAILAGEKTVTRRIIKPQPQSKVWHYTGYKTDYWAEERTKPDGSKYMSVLKPPYKVGDVIYVREAYARLPVNPDGTINETSPVTYYRADGDLRPEGWRHNWRPGIHMPKDAVRLFLKVKSVEVQRLQDILCCPGDIAKEGVPYSYKEHDSSVLRFKKLWDSTVKVHEKTDFGFDANPWVWVIEFERCEKPETEDIEKEG